MRCPFHSFDEYWPYYLSEHARKETRVLHIAGTAVAIALAVLAVIFLQLELLILALAVGYGFAWIGHFVFEENGPATFEYPLWSFRGDLRLVWLWLTGMLEPELRRHGLMGRTR